MLKNLYRLIISKLPKKYRLALTYFRVFGVFPNIENPQNFNEKVLNRILYDKDPQFSLLADKYAVRTYIKDKIGENYLIPLILWTENPNDLKVIKKWENLVIKPNHGAGMVTIIDNEPTEDRKNFIIALAGKWLRSDFGKMADEGHYSLIRPKLMVETKITSKGEDLRDYKFHRFLQHDGTIKQVLQVVAERSESGFETVFFEIEDLDKPLYSPFNYKLELSKYERDQIARIVSLNGELVPNTNYVRIDWYITKKHIYFGEITFTPGAGRSKSFKGDFGVKMGKLWVS